MNLSTTLRVIARHKVLLLIGILVAVAAAFATGFRVEDGSFAPRTVAEYCAPTQLLVSDPTSIFSTRTAPATVVDGQTVPASRDLSSATVVYAYLASSGAIQDLVEAQVGEFGEGEGISAQQRTTQPTATTNTGTYRLPILEIVGQAQSAARAEEISRAAASVFTTFAAQQQDAAGVSPDTRVQLQVIREGDGVPVDGTNPALPIVAVGIGVLLAFIALIFAVDNARKNRAPAPMAASSATGSTARVPSYQPGASRPVMPATVMSREANPVSAGAVSGSREHPPTGQSIAEPANRR